jgi:hypothetical protein
VGLQSSGDPGGEVIWSFYNQAVAALCCPISIEEKHAALEPADEHEP